MTNHTENPRVSRRAFWGVLTAIILAAVAGWFFLLRAPSAPPATRPPAIVVGTFSKALGNAPYYVARHFGWFEEHPALKGIQITYVEFNDRPAISSAFSAGNLDLLFSAEIPSILIRAQGDDTRIVLTSAYAAQEILVPKNSAITDIDQLRGKRIAVQSGTSSHYALFRLLSSANLEPQDANILYMPVAEGRTAFETGRLDAWAAWAPWVETQEVAGRGRVLPKGNAGIYSVGTMRYAFLTEHPEQAKALAEVIARAKEWIKDHPVEAQRIASEELGFELPAVQRAWSKFDWQVRLTSDVYPDFEAKARFLADQKLSRGNTVVDIRRDLVDLSLQR